jgi:hypothetical protein
VLYQAQNGVLSLRCLASWLGAWVGDFVWVTLASNKLSEMAIVLAKLKIGDLNVYWPTIGACIKLN